MDINLIRSLVTLISLALFVGLMVWTWKPSRKKDHEQASRLLFDGESPSEEGSRP
jgi:cytochrome c oxidase cbb3-type subunit IV